MIYKDNVLNKLITTAFKAGSLTMGKTDDQRYIIAGTWWIMAIDEDSLSNKVKGKLLELTGVLPNEDEYYKCSSEGNQMEIPIDKEFIEITDKVRVGQKDSWSKTDIIIDFGLYEGRVYQAKEIASKIVCQTIVEKLLDGTPEINEEKNIYGPVVAENFRETRYMFWKNRETTLVIMPIRMTSSEKGCAIPKERVWVELTNIDLVNGTDV